MNEKSLKLINSDKTLEHEYKEQASIKSQKTKYAIKLFVFECTVEYKSVRCMKKVDRYKGHSLSKFEKLSKIPPESAAILNVTAEKLQ